MIMKKELYEALCSDFTAIFQCDLIKDTLEIIKYDTGTHTDAAIQKLDSKTLSKYTEMINYFHTLYIQDSAIDFWNELQPNHLMHLLKHQSIVKYRFKTKPNPKGNQYHSFRAIKLNEDEDSFEVVIGIKIMDDLMQQHHQNEIRLQELVEEKNLQKEKLEAAYKKTSEIESTLLALCNDYNVVYLCDLENDSLRVIKDTYSLINANLEHSYSSVFSTFQSIESLKKDNENYLDCLKRENLMETMQNQDELSLQFRFKEIYMETRIVKVPSNHGVKVILGSRNINDIVKKREEQNKQLQDALIVERTFNNIIRAIGSIYNGIATINLVDKTYMILSNKNLDKDIFKPHSTGSIEQLKDIFVNVNAAPKYKDDILEFINFTTLPNRMKDKQMISMELEGISGRWYTCSFIVEKKDKDGNITDVLMTISDIDEIKHKELEAKEKLKEAAEKANQANVAKTNFLRRMSHDIRTPLNGIVGMINLAQRYGNDKEKLYECKEKVLTSLDYLLSLINDILDMSKVESNALVLESKPFDLIETLNSIIAIIETSANEHNIQFIGGKSLSYIPHRYFIGSQEYLNRLLMNIASNAIKYNKENGSITLYCKEISSNENMALMQFVCSDTGLGMSEEFQKHAFEPFTCEGKATITGYSGTGLGLSIVKDIVDIMDGSIEMDSKENVGTTFVVTIPLQMDSNPKVKVQTNGKELNLSGKKALLVEDNEINLEIATIMLQDLGLIVTPAQNGKEALDIFEQSDTHTFDYIFMDVMMPVMDGLEATRRIRSLNREDAKTTPIIALSANAFEDDIKECLDAGMNAHVAKPIDVNALKEELSLLS